MHGCDMDIFLDVADDDSGVQSNDEVDGNMNDSMNVYQACQVYPFSS